MASPPTGRAAMLFNYFLILITLLLISGLALDAGLLEWRQSLLQHTADAAAQEGMYQLARSDGTWAAKAQAQATANGFTNGANGVTVTMSNPPTSGTYAANSWAVQATVSQSVTNLFMGLVNGGKSTVAATAVAREIPTCVWIMNPTGNLSNSQFWLLSTRLTANCGLYVNTSTGYSMTVDGFAHLTTLRSRLVGNVASSSLSSGTISPHPIYQSAAKIDPLAYVTAPTLISCGYTGASISGGSFTASPGTYCGGFTINNSTVTLNPGTYIIAGGLTVTGSTFIATSGVTLYFTKNGGSSYSNINFSNSFLYLKAPTTTAYGGIVGVAMFADRNWIAHGSQGVRFTDCDITSDGAWYALNTGLYLWSTPFTYYKYAGWVIDNLYQYADITRFDADYSPLGGVSPYHYEDGVLVQ